MNSLFFAILLFIAAPGAPKTAAANPHVTIELKSPASLAAGSNADLALTFRPKKGIHINAEPAIDVVPEKNPVFSSIGAVTPAKNKEGYVDASKPVKVAAVVSASAPKGAHTVKVRVVYYLCSDAEGWCNRDEQTVDLRVTVK